MPATAFRHFEEDLDRAGKLVDHAAGLPNASNAEKLLRSDILRSGIMFATGALDAYLCDAYSWVVGGTLIAKDIQKAIFLPPNFLEIQLPVTAYLAHYATRDRWRWRMAARRMMEKKNILNLSVVENLFGPFLPAKQKIYQNIILDWVEAASNKNRLFGITSKEFAKMTTKQRNGRKRKFVDAMKTRFKDSIFQRRHDCIHNCDRPKVALQALKSPGTVRNIIRDIRFFGTQFNGHLDTQFPLFLSELRFSAATIQAATN